MWLNVDISWISEEEVISLILEIKKMFNMPMVVSVNTMDGYLTAKSVIRNLKRLLEENGISAVVGPHFVLEGIIVDDKLEYVEELNFATKGDKIVWGLNNLCFPFGIEKVLMLDKHLGIDPFSIKYKEKNLTSKIDYYFWYDYMDISDMERIIKRDNFHFSRIKKER